MDVSASESRLDREVPPMDRNAPTPTTTAVFALGCFWGADALVGALDGVVRTAVGYAGGTTPDPTYADLDDHLEAVRVEFDPTQICYPDLLDRFWADHAPNQTVYKHRYRHALFPRTDRQIQQARHSFASAEERYGDDLGVSLIENAPFHRADPHHQNYKLRSHDLLVQAFRKMLPSERAFTDSPAATLANGYVGGDRAPDRLAEDRSRLGLSADEIDVLRTHAARRQGWNAYVQLERERSTSDRSP